MNIKASEKMQRARFKPVALTAAEARKWDETLAACNWVGPGFIHIMYSMLVPRGRTMAAMFTDQLHCTAATDGYQLIFNPKPFFAYTLMKRVFIVFHEIMHNIFDHCGVGFKLRRIGTVTWEGITVPYVSFLANIIQDLIINDGLIEGRLGEYDPDWLHDVKIANHTDSWAEVYVKFYKACEKECKQGQSTKGKGKGKGQGQGSRSDTKDDVENAFKQQFPPDDDEDGEEQDKGNQDGDGDGDGPPAPRKGQFDQHLDPGTGGKTQQDDDQSEQMPERSEIEWQQAVAAGIAVAKAQGKLPASLELMFGNVLEPVVDWKDHIRALFARKVGSGGYDWRKPDRRLVVRDIIAPGRSGHGAKLVIVGGDNSGSIYSDPTLLGRWLGEIGGILEDVNPEEIILIWCDAEVHEVDTISDASDIGAIQKRGSTGGGGTSFVPVFQWIEDKMLKPDALVYLTDMMGAFPEEEPGYPVIWGTITPIEQIPPPFGDAVFIPTIKEVHR